MRKRPRPAVPGKKLVNRGGAARKANVAAKKARGGSNSKGSPKRLK